MKLFLNPYTGAVSDWDAIEGMSTGEGVAKFCPITRRPLNEAALLVTPYPGPESDKEAWLADQRLLMADIERQVAQPNAATLEEPAATVSSIRAAQAKAAEAAAAAAAAPAPTPATTG